MKELVVQSCRTLCDPMDYSPPGFTVHGILQARILKLIAFPSPGGLPDPGMEAESPALQADSLPSEPLVKSQVKIFNWSFSIKLSKINRINI